MRRLRWKAAAWGLLVLSPVAWHGGNVARQHWLDARMQEAVQDSAGATIRSLMAQGARLPEHVQPTGSPTLVWLAQCGETEAVELLLDRGMDVDVQDNGTRLTALMYAAVAENLEMMELLLRRGADPERRDALGQTALMMAPWDAYCEPGTVRLLLEHGADVNARDLQGQTALMHAASAHHVEDARLMLDGGAKVNARDNSGWTALMHAVGTWPTAPESRVAEVVDLLLQSGADPHVQGREGATALVLAEGRGLEAAARRLRRAMAGR